MWSYFDRIGVATVVRCCYCCSILPTCWWFVGNGSEDVHKLHALFDLLQPLSICVLMQLDVMERVHVFVVHTLNRRLCVSFCGLV